MFIVGIDIAKRSHMVRIIDSEGRTVISLSLSATAALGTIPCWRGRTKSRTTRVSLSCCIEKRALEKLQAALKDGPPKRGR